MRTFRGRRVLVTGGAQGIGLNIALRFAEQGAELIIADLKPEPLAAASAKLQAAGASRVSTYLLDVTDYPAILDVRECIHRELGAIHVLVNNAGTVFGGPFLDVPLQKHLKTYEVNTLGLVAMTHAFLPDLIGQDEAHIVNIASASGFVGLPWGTTYASSKWAAIGFSESIRHELRELGHRQVGVTAVCPSFVNTGLFAGAKPPKTTRELTPENLSREVFRAVQKNQPFVLAPKLVRLTLFLRGVLPIGLYDTIGRWFGVFDTMKTWRGHGSTANATPPASPKSQSAERGQQRQHVS